MSRKRRTVQQLPMLPRTFAEGEDPGLSLVREPAPGEGPEQPAYLAWLREQPCCLDFTGLCLGHVEAHHEPPKGMGGGRTDDRKAVPLCAGHHRHRHESFLVEALMAHILTRRIDYYLAWRDGRTGL